MIRTRRLVMRRITLADKDALFELRTNPVVNRYIDRPMMKSMDEVETLIGKINEGIDKNESISWVITLNDNDHMLGSIDFWRIIREHHRAEIGYVLHPEFHRKGIMQEAMDAVLDYGFHTMKLHSVEANVNPANLASIGLLERNGFVQEAYFRENYFYNGKFLDSVIYSLLTPAR